MTLNEDVLTHRYVAGNKSPQSKPNRIHIQTTTERMVKAEILFFKTRPESKV